LGDASDRDSCRRLSRSNLYYISRLRPRVVLYIQTSEQRDGCYRRGSGDIWTLTVQEYLQSSRWRRFAYRLARNPIVLFVVAESRS
jgi:hypothetical protein